MWSSEHTRWRVCPERETTHLPSVASILKWQLHRHVISQVTSGGNKYSGWSTWSAGCPGYSCSKDGIDADSTHSQTVKEQTVKVCSSALSLWLLPDPPHSWHVSTMWDWRGSDWIVTRTMILLTPHTCCLVINDYLFGQAVVYHHRCSIGLNVGSCVSSLSLWLILLTLLHIQWVQAVHLGACSPGTSWQAASAPIKS